jgi:hypothetical protein
VFPDYGFDARRAESREQRAESREQAFVLKGNRTVSLSRPL